MVLGSHRDGSSVFDLLFGGSEANAPDPLDSLFSVTSPNDISIVLLLTPSILSSITSSMPLLHAASSLFLVISLSVSFLMQ